MILLTKAIEKQLPALYATEKVLPENKVAVCKFFHPMSSWTWYAIEYNPTEKIFFGWVVGHEKEFGNFSLEEMQSTKVRGLGIERDRSFRPTKLSDLPEWSNRD